MSDERFDATGKPHPHGRCDDCGQPDGPTHRCGAEPFPADVAAVLDRALLEDALACLESSQPPAGGRTDKVCQRLRKALSENGAKALRLDKAEGR